MNERYFVDERSGCAAVVDSFYPGKGSCMDSYSGGVVKYASLPSACDGCSEEEVEERADLLGALEAKAKGLNNINNVSAEQVDDAVRLFNAASRQLMRLFHLNPNVLLRNLQDFLNKEKI